MNGIMTSCPSSSRGAVAGAAIEGNATRPVLNLRHATRTMPLDDDHASNRRSRSRHVARVAQLMKPTDAGVMDAKSSVISPWLDSLPQHTVITPHQPTHQQVAGEDLTEEDIEPEARAVGCLVGAMAGNALGAPVQHERHWQVARLFPRGLTEFWGHDMSQRPVARGHVTGEFQFLLAVGHSLINTQCCDARPLAYEVARRCDPEARRYTPHSDYLVRRLRDPRSQLASLPFLASLPVQAAQFYAADRAKAALSFSDRWDREPWGPADHGAAATMAAPIALAYRSSSWEVVEQAVQEACLISHSHPVGIDGARVMAAAVHWLLQQPAPSGSSGSGGAVGPQALLTYLMGVAQTQDMRSKLEVLQQQVFQVDAITSWPSFYRGQQWHRLTNVLSRITYHDLATAGTEATAVALWAFLTHWRNPSQAVCVAATFGGAAPATSQMVGALAGALHGADWIPTSWWQQLENQGRDSGEEQWMEPVVLSTGGSEGWRQVAAAAEAAAGQEEGEGGVMGVRDEAVLLAKYLAAVGCTRVGLEGAGEQEQGQEA